MHTKAMQRGGSQADDARYAPPFRTSAHVLDFCSFTCMGLHEAWATPSRVPFNGGPTCTCACNAWEARNTSCTNDTVHKVHAAVLLVCFFFWSRPVAATTLSVCRRRELLLNSSVTSVKISKGISLQLTIQSLDVKVLSSTNVSIGVPSKVKPVLGSIQECMKQWQLTHLITVQLWFSLLFAEGVQHSEMIVLVHYEMPEQNKKKPWVLIEHWGSVDAVNGAHILRLEQEFCAEGAVAHNSLREYGYLPISLVTDLSDLVL